MSIFFDSIKVEKIEETLKFDEKREREKESNKYESNSNYYLINNHNEDFEKNFLYFLTMHGNKTSVEASS